MVPAPMVVPPSQPVPELQENLSTNNFALNPSAPQFFPTMSRRSTSRKHKEEYTKEKAEIDSMKIELSFTKTKIADLENQLRDKEQTIKIYLQKLKLLETEKRDNLRDTYFPQSHGEDAFSHTSSDCPCLIKSKIDRNLSSILKLESRMSAFEDIFSKNTQIFQASSDSASRSGRPNQEPRPDQASYINEMSASMPDPHSDVGATPDLTSFLFSDPLSPGDDELVAQSPTPTTSSSEFEFDSPKANPLRPNLN